MLANVGHELLRELATRVELGKVSDNRAPNEVAAAATTSVVGFGRIEVEVDVEGVSERGNGLGNIACELVELLVEEGRVLGLGSWDLHENLLHHVLVVATAPRPAL